MPRVVFRVVGHQALDANAKFKLMTELMKDGNPIAEGLFANKLTQQTLGTFKEAVKTAIVALRGSFSDAKLTETQVKFPPHAFPPIYFRRLET